jgi:hypothetical protein
MALERGTTITSKLNTALAAAMIGMALTGTTEAGPITYAVALFSGGGFPTSIGGSITTDGTLGVISRANIIDWNLIGAFPDNPPDDFIFNVTGPLSGTPAGALNAQDILATPLTLSLIVGDLNSFFRATNDNIHEVQFTNDLVLQGNILPFWGVCSGQSCIDLGLDRTSPVFADGKAVPTAGAPGPIAGAGLPGVLSMLVGGFMWWRRKLTFSLMP